MQADPTLIPLHLSMEGCATQEEMIANVEATIARGYTRLNEYLDTRSGHRVSIVGAGPSIRKTWRKLGGDVMACNSALGFLLDQGVVPKYHMLWDAHPIVASFAIPHPGVTYLVAARCHPTVFERLKDCRVIVWFAGGDHNIAEFMAERNIPDAIVLGGSAAVTRGLFLAAALGYRKFHVFGADSSYSDDGMTHVNGSAVPEKRMRVWVGNGPDKQDFWTTPEWCAQVEEFKLIYERFHNQLHARIEVYGNGLLPHVARILAKNRLPRHEFLRRVENGTLPLEALVRATQSLGA